MNYGDIEEELKRMRNGRLLDEHLAGVEMFGSTHRAVVSVYLRTTSWALGRRTAPIERMPKIAKRAFRVLGAKLAPTALTTFHFRSSSVSRPRSAPGRPNSVLRGERVAVFPSNPREFAIVKRNKGAYSNRERVFTVPSDRRFLKTRIGEFLQSRAAELERHYWLSQRGVAVGRQSPVGFQTYIDRSDLPDPERSRELEADGPNKADYISFGTLGVTAAARADFWSFVYGYETREGARLQSRIEAELPYWLSPEDRREIAERLCKLFAKRSLPYWCAVHLPGADGDSRNHHLHIVWHDRPVVDYRAEYERLPNSSHRRRFAGPIFAPEKDREVQKKHWVERLRTSFADIVNDVVGKHAIRTGQRPPYFFYPGTNRDLGIYDIPQKHLGPRRSAIERSGRPSSRGAQNELAIRHRLSLNEAEASVELLRYVSILGNPAAFGLSLWEGKKRRDRLPQRIYFTMNRAWHAVRGIQMLNRAVEMEKSWEALKNLTEKLESAGYVVPQECGLPNLPIVRGSNTEPDKAPGEIPDPTQAQHLDKQDLDDELIRRFGQTLATAHIYFLNELNGARLQIKRIALAYIDPKRLPTKKDLESLATSNPITKNMRDDIRAVWNLVAIMKREKEDIDGHTAFLAQRATKIIDAVSNAAMIKGKVEANDNQSDINSNSARARRSQAITSFFAPQEPREPANEHAKPIEVASSLTSIPIEKVAAKPVKQPTFRARRYPSPASSKSEHASVRSTQSSMSASTPKLIDMQRDLPRPIGDYGILIDYSQYKDVARVFKFVRQLSIVELCFTNFRTEWELKYFKDKKKPRDPIAEEILSNGPEIQNLLSDEFCRRGTSAEAEMKKYSFKSSGQPSTSAQQPPPKQSAGAQIDTPTIVPSRRKHDGQSH